MASLLQVRGVFKSFPGVQALRGVDLELRAGEVLAVLGETGLDRYVRLLQRELADGGQDILALLKESKGARQSLSPQVVIDFFAEGARRGVFRLVRIEVRTGGPLGVFLRRRTVWVRLVAGADRLLRLKDPFGGASVRSEGAPAADLR